MIRRILLVAAAAAALTLIPSVAMAYDAPGYVSFVSDPTPTAGSSVTLTVHGPPNATLKVVVTSANGVKTYTVMTNALGVGTLQVPAGASGSATTVQVFDAAGKLVGDQNLNVVAATTTSGDSGFPTTPGATPNTHLAFTGFDGAGLAAGGGALVLVGAGAVVITKRRRSTKAPA